MYSPKIREDLIPPLYRLAKARRVPMTRLVSDILAAALAQVRVEEVQEVEERVIREPRIGYRVVNEPEAAANASAEPAEAGGKEE